MMRKLGVTQSQTNEMMDWLMDNLNDLRKVDLRTMIKLSQAVKATPKRWQKVAHAALCRR